MSSNISDQCSKCHTGISSQQATQTVKLFGDLYCANCIPEKKATPEQSKASVTDTCCNCHVVLNAKQAAFSKTAYGKPYCPDPKCIEVATKEGQAALDAAQPPEFKILKELGWTIDPIPNEASKVIESINVSIPLSRLAEKQTAVTVDGSSYIYDKNDSVDIELTELFTVLSQPKKKSKPKVEHDSVNPGQEYIAPKPEPEKTKTPEPVKEKNPQTHSSLLEYIKSFVNDDVLEIFGDSGTGKSKFAVEVARQTIASGKTVFYLDTERNLSKYEVEKLKGCQYKYTPLISEISQISRQLPKVDLVIIDSIGFPILTAYARMNMKQKGDALLNMIAIFGDLKEWAYRNNAIAIVINQPESDFNKEPGHLIRPFGDKSQFAAKEIWKTEVTQRGSVTKTNIEAFRSRSVGHKTLIAKMEVSDKGTEIKAVVE